MSKRVFVTGMGAVSALGNTFSQTWEALIKGAEGRRPVTAFDVSATRCHEAAEIDFSALPIPPLSHPKRLTRATRLTYPALSEALNQAGLLTNSGRSDLGNLPLSISTTGGSLACGESFFRQIYLQKKKGRMGTVSQYLPQKQVADLQEALGFSGHMQIIGNACSSGANAIGHAADLIQTGLAECVIAGGYEALTELIFIGFDSLHATTTTRCRPFDKNRDGLLLGEGAAFLVLESESHVLKRKVTPLCEMAGYGHATDAFHLTQPTQDGSILTKAMRHAMSVGNVIPEEVNYINAHGTGTPMNDGAEALSYQSLFDLSRSSLRISSTKAALGHTLGAAGAIEATIAIQALLEGKAPPQLNSDDPLDEMSAALPKVGEPPAQWKTTMSVNLGFGGSNAALLFKKIS